jgi:hypothetical protein
MLSVLCEVPTHFGPFSPSEPEVWPNRHSKGWIPGPIPFSLPSIHPSALSAFLLISVQTSKPRIPAA